MRYSPEPPPMKCLDRDWGLQKAALEAYARAMSRAGAWTTCPPKVKR